MHVNDMNIEFTDRERKAISKFFQKNKEFISNNNFMDYNSVKKFGDLLEKFLNDNKLTDDDLLMLFLSEIRYSQMSFKITDQRRKAKRVVRVAGGKPVLNKVINKWYIESRIIRPLYSNNNEEETKDIPDDIEDNENIEKPPVK